ncbi:MAG: hypothetical protein GX617_06135 [Lentisphaerae bacterium]|nr:glycerophosphodiester phosphodiesterase family protein [Lentisphaeria bacterium]NLE54496.1 hypothetical protein [Lentisphaerota bacterium]
MTLFACQPPRFIAHRGFTPAAPENTLAAFTAAGERAFWAIETDVRRTRDGALVCCHDPQTKDGHRVADYSFAELGLPAFAEYQAICQRYHAVPFLECKEDIVADILAEVEQAGMINNAVFSAINFAHLEECRRLNRRIFVHHIFSSREHMLRLAEMGNGGLSYNYPDPSAAPRDLLAETKGHGVRICLRAADNAQQLRDMQDLGLDYIPTNKLWPTCPDIA